MELYLTATSSVSDLTIDFIEVRLRSGKTVSLNWDAGFIDRCGDTISAHYVGVYFNEKSACGKLRKLKDMRVTEVGLYSDEFGEGDYPMQITKMEFCEHGKSVCFDSPFQTQKPEMSSVMQNLYDKFLASSWR